ncbi:hypothetical protein ILUMI_18827, partial [Ignelater luminosus]
MPIHRDSASSQGSFITREVWNKLGLTSKTTNISISGLGQNESTEEYGVRAFIRVSEIETKNANVYYLPHHSVYKASNTTTKLRVVFDVSCKTPNQLSLNDNLMTGPTIQQDIFSISIQFRLVQYVVNADINKMYRQITVDEHDTVSRGERKQ